MSDFRTLLTNVGINKLHAAINSNKTVVLKYLAVGDGGGKYPNINEETTKLVREKHRVELFNIEKLETGKIQVSAVIPPSVGGFFIREVGIFDKDKDLIAIGTFPETYKSNEKEGATKDILINFIFKVSNADVVELVTDNTMTLATKQDITTLTNQMNKKAEKKEASLITRKNLNESESQVKELKLVEAGINRTQTAGKNSDIYFQTKSPIVDSLIEPNLGSIKTSKVDGIEQIFRKYESGDNKNIYPITKSKAVAMENGSSLEETITAQKEELDLLNVNAENIVQNGDFNSNIYWAIPSEAEYNINNNILTVVNPSSASNGQVIQAISNVKKDDVFYFKIEMKSDTDKASMSVMSHNSVTHSGNGKFERLSVVVKSTVERLSFRALNISKNELNNPIQIKKAMCVNLTDVFGEYADKIVDKAYFIDLLLDKFEESYFEETNQFINITDVFKLFLTQNKELLEIRELSALRGL